MVWPPWAEGADPFWIGFWVNTFTVPTTVLLASIGFFLKNRNEKRQAAKADRKRQISLILLLHNDLSLNQLSLEYMRKGLNQHPPLIYAGELRVEVWKSFQAEIVDRGLPLDDLTFPTIGGALSYHTTIYEMAKILEDIALDIDLGRLKEADNYLQLRMDNLKPLIDSAEAQTIKAIEFLEGYEKELLPGE